MKIQTAKLGTLINKGQLLKALEEVNFSLYEKNTEIKVVNNYVTVKVMGSEYKVLFGDSDLCILNDEIPLGEFDQIAVSGEVLETIVWINSDIVRAIEDVVKDKGSK
jgi:hypothetical protein